MPREIFMGLTATDFGSSLKNDLGFLCIGFAGAFVAGLTTHVVWGLKSKNMSWLTGMAAGTAVSSWLVKYAPLSFYQTKQL